MTELPSLPIAYLFLVRWLLVNLPAWIARLQRRKIFIFSIGLGASRRSRIVAMRTCPAE
jgi:hypothetical protein